MIVYLDQNKWIELARMSHRKDNSPPGKTRTACFRGGERRRAGEVSAIELPLHRNLADLQRRSQDSHWSCHVALFEGRNHHWLSSVDTARTGSSPSQATSSDHAGRH